ncbi:MAG: GPP34 family phosphoprotein [Spartobacteria bacterium]|nr:GPP34 family phosphoprotein [Spartobacteria bacterium]
MLSFAEEIYLLALDESTGRIHMPRKSIVFDSVLIGALLGELSFLGKIDSDPENIYLLNSDPTGNTCLDTVLAHLKSFASEKTPTAKCIGALFYSGLPLEQMVRTELVAKGVLKEEKDRIMWVIPTKCYPVIDNHEMVDVERRLHELLMDDTVIPDPRDVVLVSLADVCGLIEKVLTPREMPRCQKRIEQISKMDLVTRKLRQTLVDICSQIASPTPWDVMM